MSAIRLPAAAALAACLSLAAQAAPQFVNGMTFDGGMLDATRVQCLDIKLGAKSGTIKKVKVLETQDADSGVQFDVYADFNGNFVQRDIDRPTQFNGVEVGQVPTGYRLIPAVLHSYKVEAGDLPDYQTPGKD